MNVASKFTTEDAKLLLPAKPLNETEDYADGFLMGAANGLEWPSHAAAWDFEQQRRYGAFSEDYQDGYVRGFVAGFAARRAGM